MNSTDYPPPPEPSGNKSLPAKNPYWGFWASIFFGLLVFIGFSLVQAMVMYTYGLYQANWDTNADLRAIIESLILNGYVISLAEIPSALTGMGLVLLFISLRKTLGARQYLHLNPVSLKTMVQWISIMFVFIVSMEIFNQLMQRDVPEFMSKVYSSTHNYPLLLLAVVIGAPFFEEFLFRGFLLEGLRHSPLGDAGAILLTSASWAIIHLQYEWLDIFSIFLIGILFGVAKIKTQSLYIPIAMHALMNLIASIMMALMMEDVLSV